MFFRVVSYFVLVFLVTACGGGGTSATFTVGGTVSGLIGSLVLQNEGGDTLFINADGNFSFTTEVIAASTYDVKVVLQPTRQTCVVAKGKGTLNSANVSDVTVNCGDDDYTVGGTATGLTGSVVLQNNVGDDLTVAADGNFTFATVLAFASTYDVKVLNQPATQTCSIVSGSGTVIGINISNIVLNCITNTYTVAGTVIGLTDSATVIQNNAGDDLTLTADGGFTFNTAINDGTGYAVTILTQPSNETCGVINGNGTLAGSNITNVSVHCAINPPAAATLDAIGFDIKEFQFSWTAIELASHYKLLKNPDGASGYTQVGTDIVGTSVSEDITAYIQDWANATYMLQACNAAGCTDSGNVVNAAGSIANIIGYIKASNTEADDSYGYAIALSGDGNTLAIGAYKEDSNAINLNGDETNNDLADAGAVYTYKRISGRWVKTAYLKSPYTAAGENFGYSLALDYDGDKLAVGAIGATNGSGRVYYYSYTNSSWIGQIKPATIAFGTPQDDAHLGTAVAMNVNGSRLAISAEHYDVNGNVINQGKVYIFSVSCSYGISCSYTALDSLTAFNGGQYDYFGHSLAMDYSGQTVAVSAYSEDSAGMGVDPKDGNGNLITGNTSYDTGAVYVYKYVSGSGWNDQAFIKASNAEAQDVFGKSLDLSRDGNTLVVGAYGEDSDGSGDTDNSELSSGAAYVYTRSGSTWTHHSYLKASNPEISDYFGLSVDVSGDGNTIAVGASNEDSNATLLDGLETDNNLAVSGAVYRFTLNAGTWSQSNYIKAPNTGAGDKFGHAVALDRYGKTLAVGAPIEASNATGFNGNQADDNAVGAGATYLY